MKNSVSNTTNTQIWRYLTEVLAKPHAEMGGLPICPFINTYKHHILVTKTTDPTAQIESFPALRDTYGVVALVLHGFHMGYEELEQYIDELWSDPSTTILMMHPEGTDSPLPVEYNYDEPLLIVQDTDTLSQAQQQLREKSDYYSFFREEE